MRPVDALMEIFLNKPEMVTRFPERLLSDEKIARIRAGGRVGIVELAGRDSVAAALAAVSKEGFAQLVPTYAYTGTETGSWGHLAGALQRLEARLPEGVALHDLIPVGSLDYWRAMNGRLLGELTRRYGFPTACVGCHMYLHTVRIPLAKMLGNAPIVCGERVLHNGTVKINQVPEALDAYRSVAEGFGVELLFPVKDIASGEAIKEMLGLEWEEGKEQLGCVLAGNYRTLSGEVAAHVQSIKRFLDEFAGPVAKEIVSTYLRGEVPEHREIAARVLGRLANRS